MPSTAGRFQARIQPWSAQGEHFHEGSISAASRLSSATRRRWLKAYYRAARGGLFKIGVSDELLRLANEAVNLAILEAGSQALTGGAPVQVVNNVTNMGSVYLDRNPERLTEEIPDVSD